MKTVSEMGRFPPTIKLKDEAGQLLCGESLPAVTSSGWSVRSRHMLETFVNLGISMPVISETSMVCPVFHIPAIKTYFKAYVTSDQVRHIIEMKHFTDLTTNPVFSTLDFRAVPDKYRTFTPEYVKDYVSLNQFAA
jgi:hypothetical protein